MSYNKTLKNIISKTILFFGILIFIVIFKTIFGQENTPVGITTVIALLVLLSKNLIKEPFKNFSLLLLTNLGLGFASFIAANNLWIGAILDFLSLALIGYFLGYTLTKMLILPYGLQYLFMLYAPVYGSVFIKRLLALITAAILIMISQYLVNAKNKNNPNKDSNLIVFETSKKDEVYKTVNVFGKEFKVHPIRLAYAIRIGLLTAITSFIVHYFHLEEGRWMAYTVFSLTEFYSDNCKIRSKKRLQGTIIGAIIVLLIFIFIKNSSLRLFIILIAGYLNSFAVDYRDLMILVTISAIMPVAISNGSIYAVLNRIIYVFIGLVLALIANKLIPGAKMNESAENK